jgi:hypothetical protein
MFIACNAPVWVMYRLSIGAFVGDVKWITSPVGAALVAFFQKREIATRALESVKCGGVKGL